ncbi:MAG: hypothetical protein JSV09_14985, partial [Thermoplasmata archaeon]
GLRVYRWDGSKSPVHLFSKLGGLSTPHNLEVKGNPLNQKRYVYVANGDSVKIFEMIGQPPVDCTVYSLDENFFQDPNDTSFNSTIHDVKAKDEYLYVVDSQYGLYVVNMKVPEDPEVSYRLPLADGRKSITLWDNLALVSAGEYGLDLIDISLPSVPAFIHHLSTKGEANSVRVKTDEGKYALIANGCNGFALMDIQTLQFPLSIGHLEVKGDIWNITVSGTKAYVSIGELGLKIVDVKDPWNPLLEHSLGTSEISKDSIVKDCCLYKNGLYLANDSTATDPTLCVFTYLNAQEKPSLVGTIPRNAIIQSIVINNSYLYMLKLMQGLEIFQIDPSLLPLPRGSISSGSPTHQDIWVEDKVAYIANGNWGLWIVDVSNPRGPREIAQKSLGRIPVIDVGVKGNYAYLINGSYGIRVADISNKSAPIIIERVEITSDNLENCSLYEDFLYAAGISYGVWIIDISIPSHPIIIDNLAISRGAGAIFATQEHIYIGEQCHMLHIYSAPRNLPLLDIADLGQGQDMLRFRVPGGLPPGFYDLIFLDKEGQKMRKYKALLIERSESFDIKAGLNLFGYPGKVPPQYLESDDLIKAIDSTGEIVHSLRRENPARISYWQSDSIKGDIFAIEDDYSYLLYLHEDKPSVHFQTSYYFPLEVVVDQIGYRLREESAVDRISFPIEEENYFSLDIMRKLEEVSSEKSSKEMQKLNTHSGKWESVYEFFGYYCGQNFPLMRGEGYLLYTE